MGLGWGKEAGGVGEAEGGRGYFVCNIPYFSFFSFRTPLNGLLSAF
jgi:hypothetical protein